MEGAEPEGNYQLLKAVRVGSLEQRESFQDPGCFSVDICSSLSAKPAKALQHYRVTKPWEAKEDQVGSSRMKHTLEEEEENLCRLCNFTVVIDGVNLPNTHT